MSGYAEHCRERYEAVSDEERRSDGVRERESEGFSLTLRSRKARRVKRGKNRSATQRSGCVAERSVGEVRERQCSSVVSNVTKP